MYYGKTTPELEELNKKYHDKFGCFPWGDMELEYGENEYEQYVKDIRKALELNRELADFVE